MKKIFFTFSLSFFFLVSYAQLKIVLEYDESGNRISRKIVVTPSSNTGSNFRLAGTFQAPIPDGLLSIYPNPTRHFVNVEFSQIENEDIIHYELLDKQGRLVLEGDINSKLTQVDLSQVTNGNYFLNINRNAQKSSWQIVKIG
jgi:hypothetical protein